MKTKNTIKNLIMSTFLLLVLLYSTDAEMSTKALTGDVQVVVTL